MSQKRLLKNQGSLANNKVKSHPCFRTVLPSLVSILSPSANTSENPDEVRDYLNRCILDSINKGEAPFSGELIYSFTDEITNAERERIILSELEWSKKATKVVAYCDLGVTESMRWSIERAKENKQIIEYRRITPISLFEQHV